MTPVLLHRAFEASCRRLPRKVAVVCDDERVTYAELEQRVSTMAALLRRRGVKRGDRVAIFLESSPEFAVAVHAALALGAVFVPVSPLTKASKLEYMLADTRATALLTQHRLAPAWGDAVAASSGLAVCVVHGDAEHHALGVGAAADALIAPWPLKTSGGPAIASDLAISPDDLAAIVYTSGTTGVPKGVMLSHRNMCSAWHSVQSYLQLRDDDVIGLALSPAFSYGLYHVLMALGIGATLVLDRSAMFPARLIENLARHRVTVFPGVPMLFSSILQLSNLASFDLGALRLVTNAAAPLPPEHAKRLRERLPHVTLLAMYGMTECKRISYLPPEQLALRPGSIGRGMPGQETWLVDADGGRLPNGSTGELVVSGDHVMQGYWEKPIETAETLRHDAVSGRTVLHTGDIFRSDEEGWLYFVARRDDIIKSRGEKVSPVEVENVIHALAGVRDCAVIGVPDERLGTAVKAFVTRERDATLTERDVIRHCLARLESYMAPKSVVFLPDLPRTDSGKIRKLELR